MHSGPIEIVCMHIQICTLYTLQIHVCVCSLSWNLWRSWCSESVTAERILHRRVWQHHVGITEHAQTVQAEGLDAQLVLQLEASLWVKTFRDRRECAADVLWQTGVGVIWERETDDGGWMFPPLWKTLPLATANRLTALIISPDSSILKYIWHFPPHKAVAFKLEYLWVRPKKQHLHLQPKQSWSPRQRRHKTWWYVSSWEKCQPIMLEP